MNRLLSLPVLFCGLFLGLADARALSLEFDHEFDSDAEKTAVLEWGFRALSMLPPSLHERFPGSVRVRFRSWGDRETPLAEPLCAGQSLGKDADAIRAYERYGRYSSLRKIIQINSRLLPEIAHGPSEARSLDCYHGDFYRLATATLLHEIAHAYDALDLDASVDTSARRSRGRRATVSGDPLWTVIDGFKKNRDVDRLPSPRAGVSRRESFAVHFEYFLLDPDYRCRFPVHHEYLGAHFDWSPPGGDCQPSYEVVSRQSVRAVNLDPERVYQVRYLLASPGRKVASRLGHSMLHLVLCAPGTSRGPECLEQEEQDLVLGFAARTDESPWRWIKGVAGVYDSMVFFASLRHQLQIYNQFQMRDVTSYPLTLSRAQTRRLTLRALELYWTYRGPYRFFSNNCATEIEDLLKAGLFDGHHILGYRRTPGGVLKQLADAGLIDEAQTPIVYRSGFDAAGQAAADLYGISRPRGRGSLLRWTDRLSYDDRLAALDRLESELESLRRLDEKSGDGDTLEATMRQVLKLGKRLESHRLLEEYVAHSQDEKLGNTRLRELKRLAEGDERRTELVRRFQFLVQSILTGDRDGSRGYGIPGRRETGPGLIELGRELSRIREQVSSWGPRSARLSRRKRELDQTLRLADRRSGVLATYSDLARAVRTRIVTHALFRFPSQSNSGIRSMLEERFGEGTFEQTRFSDARLDRLRQAQVERQK